MKKLLVLLLLVTNVTFAQNDQRLSNFRANLPMYSASVSLILSQTNVDPIVGELIGRVLPKIANEDVEGAVLEVSNIIYEKKGIASLNPNYTKYLDVKFHSVLDLISQNNYMQIVMTLADVALVTDKFLTNHGVPNASNYTSNKTADATISKSAVSNNLFAAPVPKKDWTQAVLDKLSGELRKNIVEVANKRTDISSEQIDDLTECIVNQIMNQYTVANLKSFTPDQLKLIFSSTTRDCLNKVGINTK